MPHAAGLEHARGRLVKALQWEMDAAECTGAKVPVPVQKRAWSGRGMPIISMDFILLK